MDNFNAHILVVDDDDGISNYNYDDDSDDGDDGDNGVYDYGEQAFADCSH